MATYNEFRTAKSTDPSTYALEESKEEEDYLRFQYEALQEAALQEGSWRSWKRN